jgi:hypothetical protein
MEREGPALYQLVYVSSAVKPFSPDELIALLESSRRRNTKAGVSGLLLYHDGNIIQLLEGAESVVRSTHARISRVSRHHGVITLLQGYVQERTFPDWSMGFKHLSSEEARSIEGYSEFLNPREAASISAKDPRRALRLLELFRAGIR